MNPMNLKRFPEVFPSRSKKATGLSLAKEIKLRTTLSKVLCAYVVQFPGMNRSALEEDPRVESVLNEILDSMCRDALKFTFDERALSLIAMEAFHKWYFSRKDDDAPPLSACRKCRFFHLGYRVRNRCPNGHSLKKIT